MITSLYHTGPVTALCCHDNSILAGIGSRLYVYSVSDGTEKNSVEVLHGRNIHGIRPESCSGETRLCIFGQKSIRLVKYDPKVCEITLVAAQIEFADWIWDVRWLEDSPALSLALGHNVVVLYDVQTQQLLETAHCQEKCIIYCAKFVTWRKEDLILAAGTVFNQVVLWSPSGKPSMDGRRKVIHRLTGHQGVIFSIDYDPLSQRICSASDDRSIILYQVKFPRPTTSPGLEDWENMDSSPLHVLYGHSARVWEVKLLTSVFVSVGEDSTCCVWSYEGKVIQKFKGHKGKSIWSMAVDRGDNSVVTAGGDHSIRLWNIQQLGICAASREISTVIPLETSEEDFPRNTLLIGLNRVLVLTNMGKLLLYNHAAHRTTTLTADETFSSYSVMAVLQDGSLIAVGNIHGILRLYYCPDGLWEDLTQVTVRDVELYKGRVFSVNWLDETTLLTTGPDGVLSLCQVDVDHLNQSVTCEVTCSLELPPSRHRWVSAATFSHDGSSIVCGDRMGSVYLYSTAGGKQKPVQTFPKIHGKAGVTSICCHGNQVYTTGRDGLYRLFSWTDQLELQLLNSNRVYKGFEWLEKLVIEEEDVLIQGFHSTGVSRRHFGDIAKLISHLSENDVKVKNMFVVWSVQSNQKVLEVECGGGHRTWGYCCQGNKAQFVYIKSREVVLKDIDKGPSQTILKGSLHGRELCDAKFLCKAKYNEGGSDVLVTCSEDTSICVSVVSYTNGVASLRVLHSLSGHISSVRCLAICPSSVHSDNTSSHPSTNSSSIPSENSKSSSVSSKTSTLQRKLIFSAGGRAQLRVSRVSVAMETKGQLDLIEPLQECEDLSETLTDLSEKLTDISLSDNYEKVKDGEVQCNVENLTTVQLGQSGRRRKKPWRHVEEYSDPETRVLDITAVSGREMDGAVPEWLYFVSAACSDGLVRFFAFDERTREINQLSSSSYHNHCVLKTCHVILRRDHVTHACGHVTHLGDHVIPGNNNSKPEGSSAVGGSNPKLSGDHVIHSSDHATTCSDDITADCGHVIHSDSHVTAESDDVTTRRAHVIILTAATDGKVAFWDVTELFEGSICDNLQTGSDGNGVKQGQTRNRHNEPINENDAHQMSPCFTLNLHQSGINSFHIREQSDGHFLLVTGGDDNAVKVNLISINTQKGQVEVKVIKKGSNEHAHAAQITGIWILSSTTILTASIDQRVCVWALEEEEDTIQMTLLDSRFVDVMDIANIDVRTTGMKHRVLLSGEGLQVLEVDTENTDKPVIQTPQLM